jgi:hypothetical protein
MTTRGTQDKNVLFGKEGTRKTLLQQRKNTKTKRNIPKVRTRMSYKQVEWCGSKERKIR